jgi:hypothetical protein
MKEDGYEPLLKHSRWCLLKRPENLTDQETVKLAELLKQGRKETGVSFGATGTPSSKMRVPVVAGGRRGRKGTGVSFGATGTPSSKMRVPVVASLSRSAD